MSSTYTVKHIGVAIAKSSNHVYDYISNPKNLPQWAEGLAGASVEKSGDVWICDSPMGKVQVRFAAKNPFGVVDHDVTLPSGEVNHNPFRVIANGGGSELVFTLFRLPRMTDADFDADAAQIEKDLRRAKQILEDER